MNQCLPRLTNAYLWKPAISLSIAIGGGVGMEGGVVVVVVCVCVRGGGLNIKTPSDQYIDFHDKDETVSRPSYLYNENNHIWKDRLYI